MSLVKRLYNGDKRACARIISLVENKDSKAYKILKEIYPKSGNAYVIGVTGPPGAGKSTLTDRLVKLLRQQELKIGVIAVDPTSPFTGGSILGDRIRMSDLSKDPGVFIRSMGTRGHLGGLSSATSAAVTILDVYGCDYIFIETVGVGQSEVDIVKSSDTTLMTMVPGLGDDIQAIKAGIMEIGDVFAVNKADRDGAKRTARELEMMLDFAERDWRPPVKLVSALNNEGVEELLEELQKHKNYLIDNDLLGLERKENIKQEILNLVKEKTLNTLFDNAHNEDFLEQLSQLVVERKEDPYSAMEQLSKRIIK
jgi:LAO/AO transport system kinase